jgi:hypothetical protein
MPRMPKSELTPEERFWLKVKKTESCWLWIAGPHGDHIYGQMNWFGKYKRAHVISWIINRGLIPAGRLVLHNCPAGDNMKCVNPAHLYLGTHKDNAIDRENKGQCVHPSGVDASASKLSVKQVRRIRKLYAEGVANKAELGRMFAVTDSAIRAIVFGRTYKAV